MSVAQPRYRCEWLRDSPGGGSSLIRCRRQRIGARGNGRGSYYDGTIISPYLQCSNWEQSFITLNLFKTCMATTCGLRVKDRSRSVR